MTVKKHYRKLDVLEGGGPPKQTKTKTKRIKISRSSRLGTGAITVGKTIGAVVATPVVGAAGLGASIAKGALAGATSLASSAITLRPVVGAIKTVALSPKLGIQKIKERIARSKLKKAVGFNHYQREKDFTRKLAEYNHLEKKTKQYIEHTKSATATPIDTLKLNRFQKQLDKLKTSIDANITRKSQKEGSNIELDTKLVNTRKKLVDFMEKSRAKYQEKLNGPDPAKSAQIKALSNNFLKKRARTKETKKALGKAVLETTRVKEIIDAGKAIRSSMQQDFRIAQLAKAKLTGTQENVNKFKKKLATATAEAKKNLLKPFTATKKNIKSIPGYIKETGITKPFEWAGRGIRDIYRERLKTTGGQIKLFNELKGKFDDYMKEFAPLQLKLAALKPGELLEPKDRLRYDDLKKKAERAKKFMDFMMITKKREKTDFLTDSPLKFATTELMKINSDTSKYGKNNATAQDYQDAIAKLADIYYDPIKRGKAPYSAYTDSQFQEIQTHLRKLRDDVEINNLKKNYGKTVQQFNNIKQDKVDNVEDKLRTVLEGAKPERKAKILAKLNSMVQNNPNGIHALNLSEILGKSDLNTNLYPELIKAKDVHNRVSRAIGMGRITAESYAIVKAKKGMINMNSDEISKADKIQGYIRYLQQKPDINLTYKEFIDLPHNKSLEELALEKTGGKKQQNGSVNASITQKTRNAEAADILLKDYKHQYEALNDEEKAKFFEDLQKVNTSNIKEFVEKRFKEPAQQPAPPPAPASAPASAPAAASTTALQGSANSRINSVAEPKSQLEPRKKAPNLINTIKNINLNYENKFKQLTPDEKNEFTNLLKGKTDEDIRKIIIEKFDDKYVDIKDNTILNQQSP